MKRMQKLLFQAIPRRPGRYFSINRGKLCNHGESCGGLVDNGISLHCASIDQRIKLVITLLDPLNHSFFSLSSLAGGIELPWLRELP